MFVLVLSRCTFNAKKIATAFNGVYGTFNEEKIYKY